MSTTQDHSFKPSGAATRRCWTRHRQSSCWPSCSKLSDGTPGPNCNQAPNRGIQRQEKVSIGSANHHHGCKRCGAATRRYFLRHRQSNCCWSSSRRADATSRPNWKPFSHPSCRPHETSQIARHTQRNGTYNFSDGSEHFEKWAKIWVHAWGWHNGHHARDETKMRNHSERPRLRSQRHPEGWIQFPSCAGRHKGRASAPSSRDHRNRPQDADRPERYRRQKAKSLPSL